jgi:hypothetical protein
LIGGLVGVLAMAAAERLIPRHAPPNLRIQPPGRCRSMKCTGASAQPWVRPTAH